MAVDTPSAPPVAAPRPARAWIAFPAAVAAVLLVYFRLTEDTQSLVYDGIALGGAVAMFAGIAIHRPSPRFAWLLLATGVLLLALGDVAYGTSQPVPSVADVFYVSAYPILGLGLLALARGRLPGAGTSTALAALGVAGVVGVVAVVFIAVPAGQEREVGLVTRLVSIGYPVLDVALLALLARPVRTALVRMPAFLLGLALLGHLVADTMFAFLNFGTAYSVGDVADVGWLLSYAAFGAALLHPDVARRDVLMPPSETWISVPSTGVLPPAPDGSTAVVRGVTGAPVVVTGLDRAPTAAAVSVSITWAQAVRYRLILTWAGVLLMGLGGAAVLASAAWQAPSAAFLAGAYGLIGSLTLVAGAIRS